MRRAAMQAPVGLRKPLNRALQIRLGQGERQTHEALERTVDREARSWRDTQRSEEHTSELQSLMRISYAVFCLKTKTSTQQTRTQNAKALLLTLLTTAHSRNRRDTLKQREQNTK